MRRSYDKVDGNFAQFALEVTPCVFEGSVSLDGRPADFRWYPSGYLVVYYPQETGPDAEYYVCPGSVDEDGIYTCATDRVGNANVRL